MIDQASFSVSIEQRIESGKRVHRSAEPVLVGALILPPAQVDLAEVVVHMRFTTGVVDSLAMAQILSKVLFGPVEEVPIQVQPPQLPVREGQPGEIAQWRSNSRTLSTTVGSQAGMDGSVRDSLTASADELGGTWNQYARTSLSETGHINKRPAPGPDSQLKRHSLFRGCPLVYSTRQAAVREGPAHRKGSISHRGALPASISPTRPTASESFPWR